jgi:hypothetical protein
LALANTVIHGLGSFQVYLCVLKWGLLFDKRRGWALCVMLGVGCLVKLLLAFASTVIPGFSLLEIHDQDSYSLLDMFVFRNGASSSTKEGSVFLCRRYACCTAVSARVYRLCHGAQVTADLCFLCQCTILSNIYTSIQRFPVNAGLCSRLCLNLRKYSETAVSQLNGRRPDRRKV